MRNAKSKCSIFHYSFSAEPQHEKVCVFCPHILLPSVRKNVFCESTPNFPPHFTFQLFILHSVPSVRTIPALPNNATLHTSNSLTLFPKTCLYTFPNGKKTKTGANFSNAPDAFGGLFLFGNLRFSIKRSFCKGFRENAQTSCFFPAARCASYRFT